MSKEENSASAAQILIADVLKSDAILFHDQYNEAYIAPMGHGGQVINLNDGSFAKSLSYKFWKQYKRPLPGDADKQAISTLIGIATYEGQSRQLNVRIARDDSYLWYDLADGKVVRISTSGWQIISKPPILFRRDLQKSQVKPELDGTLSLLKLYVNVATDEDWLLFLVYVIAAYIPDFPHPLLILHGSQGAGKTTPMRLIKRLVDPSIIEGTPLPEKISDFVELVDNHAFLYFDNISHISTNISDALARAATGDSYRKRTHYTNRGNTVYYIQKTIALNGINQVVTKADLLDRSILIKLKRITPENRIPEEEFWTAFNHDKPQLLGAIFDTLVKALAIYPDVNLSLAPRMADFTRWGCAIAEACGYTQEQFLDAYKNNIGKQNDEAIDASPVARAIISLMKEYDHWSGSPDDLLSLLNSNKDSFNVRDSPLWPKAAEWMTRRLNEAQTNLNAIGIHIEVDRNSDGRVISITQDQPEIDDSMSALSVTE
jgi:hypothetical protein